MTDDERPPQRLVDAPGPAGDCVRRALASDEPAPSVPRFVALREKRLGRVRRQRGAFAVLLASLGLVLAFKLQPPAPTLLISAEKTAVASSEPQVSPLASQEPALTTPPPTISEVTRARPSAPPAQKRSPARDTARSEMQAPSEEQARSEAQGPSELQASSEPEQAPGSLVKASGSAKACAELAREGAADAALGCYSRLASGNGMGAELALFELARLEGKVLRRPAQALQTLESYRRRFPQGSLRAEVMLAQIEWLVASGDAARAKALIDEALASGLLRERTAELERVRDSLLER
jgi:hypothetical protein